MQRLLVVGLSHHASPLQVRERMAIDEATWRAHTPRNFSTVLLSTCNRLEVYAWIVGPARPAVRSILNAVSIATDLPVREVAPHFTTRVGREALVHLIRVASGLDSAVVGEEQIRGQVRRALLDAESSAQLAMPLRGVFQRAIDSARRIRGSTRLGQAPSIAAAGIGVATRLANGQLHGGFAVVLGAGAMARAATDYLLPRAARVLVINRTPAHAALIFADAPVEIGGFETLPDALGEAALVVCATASRKPVVEFDVVQRAVRQRATQLVLLDIALPRDVDARVREIPGVTLLDLDDLERLCPIEAPARQLERQRAESLATQEADRLERWLRSRSVSPAIIELRTYVEEVRTSELRRSASRLRDLSPEQISAVHALTTGIVNKLMHGPTVALREAGVGRSRARILRVVRPQLRAGVARTHGA